MNCSKCKDNCRAFNTDHFISLDIKTDCLIDCDVDDNSVRHQLVSIDSIRGQHIYVKVTLQSKKISCIGNNPEIISVPAGSIDNTCTFEIIQSSYDSNKFGDLELEFSVSKDKNGVYNRDLGIISVKRKLKAVAHHP